MLVDNDEKAVIPGRIPVLQDELGLRDTQIGLLGSAPTIATPCREWTVRDLLAHTTGVIMNMGRGASGETLLPEASTVGGDQWLRRIERSPSPYGCFAGGWETFGL